MLKAFVKHRPRQLIAVYVEPRRIEVLRAHRQWRSWQIDGTEDFDLPEGENVYDFLHRLSLKPRGKTGAALILFLPRSFYSFHREHYPTTIQDRLEEALSFDWEENIFHEHERTLHFFGPSVPVDRSISVPIFSLQTDVYERFHQVLNGGAFRTFTVIPSALAYKAFFASALAEEDPLPLEILGRVIDSTHLEIHRFYNGTLIDSMVVGKNPDNLRLFRENLHCMGNGDCQESVHIHLFCTGVECGEAEDYGSEWREENLPLKVHSLDDSLLSNWVRYLLEQEQIQTFDEQLVLKPWKTPPVVWVILAIAAIYSAFAFFEVRSLHQLQETSRNVKKEALQLETQWKPIEQLQTRISKFHEDQKTLTQFNQEGYPLLELLNVLSQSTPDDTWLNYLSLRKGQLILRGESKSAIKYLSELSKIDGLTDVRFASPVTKNPASDQERFNVQLQLELDKLQKTFDSLGAEKGDEEKPASEVAAEPSSKEADKAEEGKDEENESDQSQDQSEDESQDEAPEEAPQPQPGTPQ